MSLTFKNKPMPEIQSIRTIDFDKLEGLNASLYYYNEMNKFQLGSVVFEVLEDEQDGYRSTMGLVKVVDTNAQRVPGNYMGGVKIVKHSLSDFDGYNIVDENDGHVWLTFGTTDIDDYYPCFTFNFYPKPNLVEQIKSAIV
jgi:hypothetical protein